LPNNESRFAETRPVAELAPAKLNLMREICNVVGDRGLFLIYENVTPDGEDRDAHLLRWERHYQLCTALTPEEYRRKPSDSRTLAAGLL
jgi:hypothetical protein